MGKIMLLHLVLLLPLNIALQQILEMNIQICGADIKSKIYIHTESVFLMVFILKMYFLISYSLNNNNWIDNIIICWSSELGFSSQHVQYTLITS